MTDDHKIITNVDLLSIISGGGSYNRKSRVFGGNGSNEVISTSVLLDNFERQVIELVNITTEDGETMFENVIDQDGMLIITEQNVNALDSLNDIFISLSNILYDINRQKNNLNYNSSEKNILDNKFTEFFAVLRGVMPVLNKAYNPDANNIMDDIEADIDPDDIISVIYVGDVLSLDRGLYFNNWSDQMFVYFINYFRFCRKTYYKVFQYYINLIENTRNAKNRQVYTTKLIIPTEFEYKHDISYYQKLLDRILELIIMALEHIREEHLERRRSTVRRRGRRHRRRMASTPSTSTITGPPSSNI